MARPPVIKKDRKVIVDDLSQMHKFNDMWCFRVKGRILVRADGTMTAFVHIGRLDAPFNHKYWRDMGYIYAIKVTPKDSMEAPEHG